MTVICIQKVYIGYCNFVIGIIKLKEMKNIYILTGLIGCMLTAAPNVYAHRGAKLSGELTLPVAKTENKILVAYFTLPETDRVDASSGASRVVTAGKMYGSTEYIAMLIGEATGGELFAIRTAETYPDTHRELVELAKKEKESASRPKLSTHIRNLQDYDIIFVGYPNWWFDMPMPLYSFFEEYDFAGKTVIPFCTHGGSRFSQSVKTITTLEKDARVIQGPSVSGSNVPSARENVLKWLKEQGFLQ